MLGMLGITEGMEATVRWILRYQRYDGGFGTGDHSDLRSTFHAVSSLNNLGYSVRSLRRAVAFVRSCEQPLGGFSVVPIGTIPYMEDTYGGVKMLHFMGERCAYPAETANRVFKCLNSNGGFRRSIYLGISTFEDTYLALSVLRELGEV